MGGALVTQLALDLVAQRRARRSDPATSKDAARAATSVAQAHFDRILAVLDVGRTIYEIGALAGLSHVQVARRMPELETLGKARRRPIAIDDDGDPVYATRPSPSGRACVLWERVG